MPVRAEFHSVGTGNPISVSIEPSAPSSREGKSMRVDPKDGRCRSCGGTLEITDSDDATMSVACDECGDSYEVEPDAFGDGCVTYYIPMQIKQAEEAGEFDDE